MPEFAKPPTIATLNVMIRPESNSEFVEWQAKLNKAIAGFPGFVSLEFLATSSQHSSWMVVQRFYDENSIVSWRKSNTYLELIRELQNLVIEDGFQEKMTGEDALTNGVTEVIISRVMPENEKIYREWSAKIHQIEAKFPGFRGVYIQSPAQNKGKNWITLLQFDTPENLDHWLESAERQEILKEASAPISSLETHRVISPYAGWFYSIAKIDELPSVWKQTMIVLVILFPIVMMEQAFLSPLTAGLNPSLAMFIGNAVSVSLISFPMMPIVINLLGWWLFPKGKNRVLMTVVGTLVVLLAYVVEIILFWGH